jgi:hypothetical protein
MLDERAPEPELERRPELTSRSREEGPARSKKSGPVAAGAGNARAARAHDAKPKERRRERAARAVKAERAEPAAPPAPAPQAPSARNEDGVALKMPPPPATLSAAATERVKSTIVKANRRAAKTKTLPDAQEHIDAARAAHDQPKEEVAAEANQEDIGAHAKTQPPSLEAQTLIFQIRMRLAIGGTVDDLVEYAQKELATHVAKNTKQVTDSYTGIDKPPEGGKPEPGAPLEKAPEAVTAPETGAAAATPDAIPATKLSLEGDVAATDQKIEDAGLNREPAMLVQTGVIADIREQRAELGSVAEQDIKNVENAQNEILSRTGEKQQVLDQATATTIAQSRIDAVVSNFGKQAAMAKSETDLRRAFMQAANLLVNVTRGTVEQKLTRLRGEVDEKWAAATRPAGAIKQYITEVGEYAVERRSGVSGKIVGVAEDVWSFFGGDTEHDRLMREIHKAKVEYVDLVCRGIETVSSHIETVISQCHGLIRDAKAGIDKLISAMPESVQAWAQSQKGDFDAELGKLSASVSTAREELTLNLLVNAVTAVQEVERLVNEIREKCKSIIGKIADFVSEFIDDPVRAIINGLLDIVGISRSTFWRLVEKFKQVISDIADDPMKFANNLMSALEKGFSQFFDNIGKHLMKGLIEWLFSKMNEVNVEPPKDLSLNSILTFFLQVMGITWARIRKLLAKHLGEENVAVAEKAFELIKTLIELGPSGIVELIKDKLDPKSLLDTVLEAAIDFMIEAIIKKVTVRIIAMLNPVGAILQAIEAIYRVVKWVIENAARIFKLIEIIVDGAVDIMAGNIGGMANAIETGLGMLVAPVIDFLAGFLGFDGLPAKIAQVVAGLQARVEAILDKVIGFVVAKAKALLSKIFGKDKDKDDKGETIEVGKKVEFEVDGEKHSLWVKVKSGRAQVIMMSKEMRVPQDLTDGEEGVEKEDAGLQKVAGLTDQIEPAAAGLSGAVSSGKKTAAEAEKEDDKIEALEDQLKLLIPKLQWKRKLPKTAVANGMDGGRASDMLADPLTKHPGNTTGKAADGALQHKDKWEKYVEPSAGGKRGPGFHHVVGAHLLHHDMHGPQTPWNIADAKKTINERMKVPEKDALEIKDGKHKNRVAPLRYHVKVTYHSNQAPTDPNEAEEEAERHEAMKALIAYYFAKTITVTWSWLGADGKAGGKQTHDATDADPPEIAGTPAKSAADLVAAAIVARTSSVSDPIPTVETLRSDIQRGQRTAVRGLKDLRASGLIVEKSGKTYPTQALFDLYK